MNIPPVSTRALAATLEPADARPVGFRDALGATIRRVADGDRALARIVSAGATGAPIAPDELLRLQASVYRTTQELDLVGRLVDKATQAVKTTLTSQT